MKHTCPIKEYVPVCISRYTPCLTVFRLTKIPRAGLLEVLVLSHTLAVVFRQFGKERRDLPFFLKPAVYPKNFCFQTVLHCMGPTLNNLLIVSTRHTSPENTRKCLNVTQLLLLSSLRQNSDWVVKFVRNVIPVHNWSTFQKVYVCNRNSTQSVVAWFWPQNSDKSVYVNAVTSDLQFRRLAIKDTELLCITSILCADFFLFTLWELSIWVIHTKSFNCVRRRPTRVGM